MEWPFSGDGGYFGHGGRTDHIVVAYTKKIVNICVKNEKKEARLTDKLVIYVFGLTA